MEPVRNQSPYAGTALVVGSVFGVLLSLFYYGSMAYGVSAQSAGVGGLLVTCLGCCLLAILPGIVGNQKYISDNMVAIDAGKGALIGLLAGVGAAVLFSLFDLVWLMFGFNVNALQYEFFMLVAQNAGMEADMRDALNMFEQASEQPVTVLTVLISIFTNSIGFGLVNLLSGMAAAAIFSRKHEKPSELI